MALIENSASRRQSLSHRLWHPGQAPLARILVVDDEELVTVALEHALTAAGYAVEGVTTGQAALVALQNRPRDVMVLDLVLPDISGIEVMRRARQIAPRLLIIVLTGQAELESAIAAVQFHAVDYLTKPATLEQITETVARSLRENAQRLEQQVAVRTLNAALDAFQRVASAPASQPAALPQVLHAPPVLLDRLKHTVVLERDPPRTLDLTRGETDVLATLMAQPGRPLALNELAYQALGLHGPEWEVRNVIAHHIHRLRQKLELNPNKPRLILTVRKSGYQFEPDEG